MWYLQILEHWHLIQDFENIVWAEWNLFGPYAARALPVYISCLYYRMPQEFPVFSWRRAVFDLLEPNELLILEALYMRHQ